MILAFAVALILTGCGAVGDKVPYEALQPGQVPAKVAASLPEGVRGTGISEIDGNTYAFIMTESGQEIEILSVERAEVGIDIHYRIKATGKGEPQTKVIKISNRFSLPVGFILAN